MKDLVVQMAVKLVIEPIFEADFSALLIRIPPEEATANGAEHNRAKRQRWLFFHGGR